MVAEKKKVIFAGLDNGGKTSIILSLQQKFSFMNARPTMGLQRSNFRETKCLGMEFVAWDMGGQAKFREEYFKQRYRVFSSVATMFYVIDIQDEARFDESIEYYQNIIRTFDELKEYPRVVICYHKSDPDIINTPEIEQRVSVLNPRLLFKPVTGEPIEFLSFRTSIHDMSSIITAFSEGVIRGSPKEKIISDYLKDYAKATFSSAVILMDENSLIVGSHFTKKLYMDICEAVAPRFLSAMERICNYNLTAENVIVNLKFSDKDDEACADGDKDAMVFVRSLKTPDNTTFSIIALSRNKNTYKLTDKYLAELALHLAELITVMSS